MDRSISRRDFLNGVAMAAGALAVPDSLLALEQDYAPEQSPDYYPPRLTGMRGSHAGSFEVAHQLRDRRQRRLRRARHTGETYDLVVVGGGLSGLAAAYYFVANVGRSARVLVLDNHDDFGGHAKRNEFIVDGKMLVLNGGTLNIESPLRYNHAVAAAARGHRRRLSIASSRPTTRNAELYQSFGLRSGHFFDKRNVGRGPAGRCRPHAGGGGRRGGYTPEYVAT